MNGNADIEKTLCFMQTLEIESIIELIHLMGMNKMWGKSIHGKLTFKFILTLHHDYIASV